jgi:hypothetical protein
MITSFIHFKDLHLNSIEVYSYQEGMKPKIKSFALNQISSRLADSTNILMMIPSQLFGFMKYENQAGHKNEILKANALIQIEEQLISDVSSLAFFYNPDLQLASWIESTIFESMSKSLDGLDAEITMIPEHYLIQGQGDTLFIRDNSFIAAFDNHSGFGGNLDILSDYLGTIDSNSFNTNEFLLVADTASAKNYFPEHKKIKQQNLTDLHRTLLQHQNLSAWNLFQRKISLRFLKLKFKLSSIETSLIAASVLIILIAPLMINAALLSSITSYQSNTMEIFRQLNPNFTRLVNPKAQIDDLTREVPLQNANPIQNLEALSYIERLVDESIEKIDIDLMQRSVSVTVQNLPSYKLALMQEAIKIGSASIDSKGLLENSNGLSGTLLINYESD